jgi:hypothetical protein
MARPSETAWGQLLRGGTAVAALLAGSVVLAVAAAGLLVDLLGGADVTAATTIAFGLASLVPAAVVITATVTVTEDRRSRRLAGVGGLIVTASVLGWTITGPSAPTASPIAALTAVGYAVGVTLPLGALLRTVSGAGTGANTTQRASWVATDRRQAKRQGSVPADGGSTDSELSFPLDADEDDDRSDR